MKTRTSIWFLCLCLLAAACSDDSSTPPQVDQGAGDGPAHGLRRLDYVPHEVLDPVFGAVVESVDEAVINAMVAAEDMTGRDGNFVGAIDHDELMQVMARYGR